MAKNYEDDEIECEIIESYGAFSAVYRNWIKEVNLVRWNGRPAKLDIRSWQTDHEKCGKGITLTNEEAEELLKLLAKILKQKTAGPETGEKRKKTSKKQASKKPEPPKSLEPFYDELELLFGAAPDKCKSARNTLLKKYHPDKNSGNIDFATRKTIKIKEAHEKIMEWWNRQAES